MPLFRFRYAFFFFPRRALSAIAIITPLFFQMPRYRFSCRLRLSAATADFLCRRRLRYADDCCLSMLITLPLPCLLRCLLLLLR